MTSGKWRVWLRRRWNRVAWVLLQASRTTRSVFSTLEELVAISKAVAAYGGVYNTHMRYHLGDQFLDPVHETLDVARQADIPIHIAHYLISGIHTWGLSSQRLALVDSARAEGIGRDLRRVLLSRRFHHRHVRAAALDGR